MEAIATRKKAQTWRKLLSVPVSLGFDQDNLTLSVINVLVFFLFAFEAFGTPHLTLLGLGFREFQNCCRVTFGVTER